MKLNLQLIASELPNFSFEGHLRSAPTRLACTYPLVFREDAELKAGPVYIAKAARLPRQPLLCGGRTSLVCIGEPPAAYFDDAVDMLITRQDATEAELLEAVAGVFWRYYRLEEGVRAILEDDDDPARVCRAMQPFLNNPMNLCGPDFKTIAHIVGDLSDVDAGLVARYRASYGGSIPLAPGSYLPSDALDQIAVEKDFREKYDAREPGIHHDCIFGYDYIFYRIRIEEGISALFVIDGIRHVLGDRDLALACILSDFLRRCLRIRKSQWYERVPGLGTVVRALIEEPGAVDGRAMDSLRASLGWQHGDELACLVLRTEGTARTEEILGTQALGLTRALGSECFVVLGGRIVFVLRVKDTVAGCAAGVARALEAHAFTAGLSDSFFDLRWLSFHYAQAQAALELGDRTGDGAVRLYERHRLDNWLGRCAAGEPADVLVPASYRRLLAYDRKKGANLLGLLRTYLDNNLSIAATARNAYLHRNTVIYRLGKIEEIGGLDLSNPDARLEMEIALRIAG